MRRRAGYAAPCVALYVAPYVALYVALAVAGAGGVAAANAPERSLRPVTREHVFPPALPSFAPDESLRPRARPGRPMRKANAAAAPVAPDRAQVSAPPPATPAASDPVPRKRGLFGTSKARICGDRNLVGEEVAPVPGRLPGCGIPKDAIRLYEVRGIRLSTPAVINCSAARSLSLWVDKGLEPAVKRYGGGVVEMKVAASYACRTRNNRKGAKISEHGKGNALDLPEFRLKNGDTLSVARDWGKGRKGRILKSMHNSACGPFGTVLGPNADRYHQDHFHFDVARYRGGPYCR